MEYVPPEFNKSAFHCPTCNVYAQQQTFQTFTIQSPVEGLFVTLCAHCNDVSVWFDGLLLHPEVSSAPLPHPEIPADVSGDFEEARNVFGRSPRSSAALLRLAIQKLCVFLGLPGKNLNSDIGELVKAGLSPQVQKSLDIVRVVGNNQVHPGTMDVRDDPKTAAALFELVNIIVEDRIARPKQIEALYQKLPEGARKQIEERDATTSPTAGK